MGLLLVWRHKLLCMHVYKDLIRCKSVCDIKQGIDPYPLLAWSCDRWWPDFVTFTACKRSIFGLKRGKKAQCVSNRCKDLFKWKKYFGVMGMLSLKNNSAINGIRTHDLCNNGAIIKLKYLVICHNLPNYYILWSDTAKGKLLRYELFEIIS